MDIDGAPVPPPQEYSDPNPSESSMNFDYLTNLNARMDSSSVPSSYSSIPGISNYHVSSSGGEYGYGHVDESKVIDRPINLNERFVSVLDQLDVRVEKFRKDAHGLQEKKDFLWMSIDLIKSNESLQGMSESEREEIICYIQRIISRLSTVELNVRTVRDNSQEDSLCQINTLIDMLITIGDPVLSRQKCQQYLNACSSSSHDGVTMPSLHENPGVSGHDEVIVDKKFENTLLGCTLDDQKNIKKRLHALMGYLNKQMVRD